MLILAIGVSNWVQYARTVRGSTMVENNKEYVQAARVIGLSPLGIMSRHVLPNVLGPVLVIATINLATAILTEATLSFLGVGVPPTQPSLGTLIRIGNDFLFSGRVVDYHLSRGGAGDHGAFDQPAGRLAARRPQSEAALKRGNDDAATASVQGKPMTEVAMRRMLFLGAVLAAATLVAGCQTWGETWSEVTGRRYYRTELNRGPTIIEKIDDTSTPRTQPQPYRMEPGRRVLTLQGVPLTPGWRGGGSRSSPSTLSRAYATT